MSTCCLPACAASEPPALSRVEMHPPELVGEAWRFVVETPDEDITRGAEWAVQAFYKGAMKKGGVVVPTVSGQAENFFEAFSFVLANP